MSLVVLFSRVACVFLSFGLRCDAAGRRYEIKHGILKDQNSVIGNFTSQLQSFIDSNYDPISNSELSVATQVNGTGLRYLEIEGEYKADVSLSLPSMFVLTLKGSLSPAANLSMVGTPRFAAMVQLNNTRFSAVIGGTYDASSLPKTSDDNESRGGYMALSITGGAYNAIRSVRAMANNSDSIIAINQSPHGEVADCVVGGDDGDLGLLQTRCIWTLATSQALVHDNHVKYCAFHALDFDAFTSNSAAYNNFCEQNGQEGIFLEESAEQNVLVNNTCQNNENGIGVYSNAVGPVANNFVLNNVLVNNRRNGLTAGGLGDTEAKISLQNIFASNHIAGNAWDRSDTPWGPAPKSQVNPAHGATSGDFWSDNTIIGDNRYEEGNIPENASLLVIFEPEQEESERETDRHDQGAMLVG